MLSSGVSLVDISPLPLGSTVSLIGLLAVILPAGVDTPRVTLFVSINFNSSFGITSLAYRTQPLFACRKFWSGLKDTVDLIAFSLAL